MTAFNFITMKSYTGQNAGLAGNGTLNAFASFKQLKDAGHSVKKGAKSVSIFCGYRKKKQDNGTEKTVPVYGRVFDIIDTSAGDDPEFLAYLKKEIDAGKIVPVTDPAGSVVFG